MTARTWFTYANDHGESSWIRWRTFGQEWAVKLADPTVPAAKVAVVEDPTGDYLGYLEDGETEISLICLEMFFSGQFQNGLASELERGRGVVVRVRIDVVEPAVHQWALYANDYGAADPARFRNFGEHWKQGPYNRAMPVKAVTVAEDADGDYRAWLPAGAERPGIICVAAEFEAHFQKGSAHHVSRGRGVVLPVIVERRPVF